MAKDDGGLSSDRKVQNAIRKVDQQLYDAAIAMLKPIADPLGTPFAQQADFRLQMVRGMDPKRLTDSQRTDLNMLLGYGEKGVNLLPGGTLPPPPAQFVDPGGREFAVRTTPEGNDPRVARSPEPAPKQKGSKP